MAKFKNPFRPGAGHMPPYLAGREDERSEFSRLLKQDIILENLILTGLRGLGKTVLLETFKPMAINAGWLWAGTDLSESVSISEENLTIRLLTDLSVVTSPVILTSEETSKYFSKDDRRQSQRAMDYKFLMQLYGEAPGLCADKLKFVLGAVWILLKQLNKRGIVFAYDEAQNLADHAAKDQYPLSLLLDVFQSIQRKEIPFMLALTGLPTLLPKLVEARTFAERMFRVIFLHPLNEEETKKAISRPVKAVGCPISFSQESLKTVWQVTRGYPYFVQYVCREAYDVWVQCLETNTPTSEIPVAGIVRKLDSDFFAGRWARATDRQRALLTVAAELETSDGEFTVQEIVQQSEAFSGKPFSASHVSQMLSSLSDVGLIYKNRHGKYSFAVPLMNQFIKRQTET